MCILFQYFDVEPYTPYTVVTEKKTATNPEPYLLKEPKEMLEKGEFTDVPWMVGVVQDEGIIRAARMYINNKCIDSSIPFGGISFF